MRTNNNTDNLSSMFDNTNIFSVTYIESITLPNGKTVSIFETNLGTLKDKPELGIIRTIDILRNTLNCPIYHFHDYVLCSVDEEHQELNNAYFYTYELNEEYVQIYLFKED